MFVRYDMKNGWGARGVQRGRGEGAGTMRVGEGGALTCIAPARDIFSCVVFCLFSFLMKVSKI